MKTFYKALIVCAGLAAAAPLSAQSIYFDQYHQTPLLTNPSFGAFRMDVQATVGYRTLNVGGGNSDINSLFASVAYPLIKRVRRKETHYGYAGVTVISDRTGTNGAISTTGGIISGGYRVPITKTITTAFGLGVGFFQRKLNTAAINTDYMFDPNTGVYVSTRANGESTVTGFNESKLVPVVNFGASIFRQNKEKEVTAYFGISGSNLNSPSTSFYGQSGTTTKYPIHFAAIGGIRAFETYQFMVTPTLRYVYVNALSQQANVGSLFHLKLADKRGGFLGYGSAGVGLWYNVNGSAITSVELNQPNYKFGLAYDWFLNGQASGASTISQVELFFTYKKYLGRERLRKNSFRPGVRSGSRGRSGPSRR